MTLFFIRRILSLLLALALTSALLPLPARAEEPLGASASIYSLNPLREAPLNGSLPLSTAAELLALAAAVNRGDDAAASASYHLTGNIDLSGEVWVPIGTALNAFTGSLDGDGYAIQGLRVSDGETMGLFGVLAGTVEDLRLERISLSADDDVHSLGGIAGLMTNGSLLNCAVSGMISGGENSDAGSLVGSLFNNGQVLISGCEASGSVSGNRAGGLAGWFSPQGGDILVKRSFSTAQVEAKGSSAIVGGLLGSAEPVTETVSLEDCYALGDVGAEHSDPAMAGGIVGGSFPSHSDGSVQLRYCFAAGKVSAAFGSMESAAGGLVGGFDGGGETALTGCFAINEAVAAFEEKDALVGQGGSFGSQENFYWDGLPSRAENGAADCGMALSADALNRETAWNPLAERDSWSVLGDGSLPTLIGMTGKQDGTMPAHLRSEPGENATLPVSCREGTELPASQQARTLALETALPQGVIPTPLIVWDLEADGPILAADPDDSEKASLLIPADWTGEASVTASLDLWPDVKGSLLLTVYQGDLGQAGGVVAITRKEARFGDRLDASFTQPDRRPATGLAFSWLINDAIVGSGSSLPLTDPAWIGESIRVRATAANYQQPVESSSLKIGKALYDGVAAAPTLSEKTVDSVTLTAVNGCEYALLSGDGVEPVFQGDPVFSGLVPGATYSFVQRMAETATVEPSPASDRLTVTLDEADPAPVNPTVPEQPTTLEDGARGATSTSGNNSAAGNGPRDQAAPAASRHQPVSRESALSATRSAVASARASGRDTAIVRLCNPGTIRLETLRAMAAEAGMPLLLHADTLSADGKRVEVRITLDPAMATCDLDLFASLSSPDTSAVKSLFNRHFSADIAVVTLGQAGDYGLPVQVAAWLPGYDGTALYRYSRERNTYAAMRDGRARAGSDHYVRYSTTHGGITIISNQAIHKDSVRKK